jgi:hypothetical protein
MAAIQIGKYRRPGIFFEEFDLSIIPPPPAPAPLASSLVVGFSKKGPINTPILISNVDDLEKIYGPLDRTLERKGSYFHRTIAKILETSPVLAMNLLPTSDELDRIQYRSLSTATDKMNSSVIEIPFRYIHDTSSFWTRDNETFIDNVKNEENGSNRLFHITNISNRFTSLFIFKSKLTGFDQPLVEYYGTADKTPPYVNILDYASDYMVDVLAVSGDWSNYQELAVDVKWSAYFDTTGLKKTAIREFAADRNVNTLAFYEGCSLIPFFTNSDGRNIFIETVINNDTDRTGLFCAFNSDKLENDYRNDMVDLVGNNLSNNNSLLDKDISEVEFLSYKDRITEINPFKLQPLDEANGIQSVMVIGSAFAGFMPITAVNLQLGTFSRDQKLPGDTRVRAQDEWYDYGATGSIASQGLNPARTSYNANELIRGVRYMNTLSIYQSGSFTSSTVVRFDVASQSAVYLGSLTASDAYFVVNGKKTFIQGATSTVFGLSFSIPHTDYTPIGTTATYHSAFHLTPGDGVIKITKGSQVDLLPILPDEDVVLGFATYRMAAFGGVQSGYFANDTTNYPPFFTTVGITSSSTSPLSRTSQEFLPNIDYTVTQLTGTSFRLTMLNTAVADVNGGGSDFGFYTNMYYTHRKIRWFNSLVSLLDSVDKNKMCMIIDQNYTKVSLENASISQIQKSESANKSFVFDLGFPITSFVVAGNLFFYQIDNEFFSGSRGFISSTQSSGRGSSKIGVAGKYSDVLNVIKQGNVNTGDFFYPNFTTVLQSNRVVFSQNSIGQPVIVFTGTALGEANNNRPFPTFGGTGSLFFPDSKLNFKPFSLVSVSTYSVVDPLTGTAFLLANTASSAYLVDKSTVNEDLGFINQINSTEDKLYLSIDTLPTGEISVLYTKDNLFDTVTEIGLNATGSVAFPPKQFAPQVISELANLKQTVEIQNPTGYNAVENKILVFGTSYPTIKVGDFLQARVDTEFLATNETGRRLTRIVNKKAWSVDPTYMEITCDAAIQKFTIQSGVQTLAYTTIDNYSSTYKALTLKGFRIREDSLPDGTEETQQSILNMVAKGTPLFKALTNKDSIDFRYVVDSFGLGLIEDSKQQLVDIVGDRLDCFGFINMPSIRQFKNSANPSFTNTDGTINTGYIAAGGNEEANPRFLYSFGKGKGVSAVGYFLPYMVANDNGRPAELPPAMFVANTYLRKITGANPAVLPWTIAAGVTNGRIQNVQGVETNFSFEDIENLNIAQMNPIVFKKNRGFVIETENTAQVIYKSALSYIHVREVLIELERELATMLLFYQWQFNTPEVRAEIKLKADGICEKYLNKNGLYNYFNKCDEENNTPDLIDRQIGVIDTYVEPIKGMGVIVNNITILRTGGIEAGGFA